MPTDRESRRIAQEQVVTALARHTSYLYRASTAQVNAIAKAIESLSLNMTREVGERLDNLTPAELSAFSRGRYTTDRLRGLRKVIDGWAVRMGETLNGMALGGFEELAGHEAEFARTLLSESIEGTLPAAPTAAAAYASAVAKPVLGELVEDMLADIPERAKRQVYSRIRQGISQGETNYQIIRALRGTKALNYKDGVLQTSRNDVERVVRTGRTHISNESYTETYRALGVEEVVWTSTLDGRTCLVADSLIDTPSGKRPIESLVKGDAVMGGSGQTKLITGTIKSSTRKLCRVTLSNGEKVTCTQDHLFWTSRGWVEAKDLSAGEKLPDRL